MLFYFITGPVGRQHTCVYATLVPQCPFLSFVLCNIKLSNPCKYYLFYLKLKIKSMSMSMVSLMAFCCTVEQIFHLTASYIVHI